MKQIGPVEPRKSVFISYSRVDGAFAEKLRGALISRGYEAYLDKEDILPGEPWRARIEGLILAADAVVFVMSPSSIASEICGWEVRRSLELKKSLTPLHWCIVPSHAVPEELSERNYVFFDAYERSEMKDEAAFESAITRLETALNVTASLWVREHTKWVARAVEWDQAKPARPAGQLLRSGDITAAQAWVSRRPESAQIPDVVFQFVDASLKKEEHDRHELIIREQRISQRTQNLVALEARRAREALHYSSAMRLALSAEPSEEERGRGITQEPVRHAELAAAAQTSPHKVFMSGHSGPLTCIGFSPDGAFLVTGSDDKTVRLWDAKQGNELIQIKHDGAVRAVVLSSGGTRLATACNGTACIWNVSDGSMLFRLAYKADDNVSFSSDGGRIATIDAKTARVWDIVKGIELFCATHEDTVNAAVLSFDGTTIVTASGTTAHVWDVPSGAELLRVAHKDKVNDAAFNADRTRLVTASDDNTARVWELVSGVELCRLVHGACVKHADFSPNGKKVITRSEFDAARARAEFDPESGGKMLSWFDESYRVSRGDDSQLPGANDVCVWNSRTGAELRRLTHDDSVYDVAFSPEGGRILTGSSDRTARLWNVLTGVELMRVVHDSSVELAAFSPDGGRIATVCGNAARIWDTFGGSETSRFECGSEVNFAVFSPDGDCVVTGAELYNPAERDNTVALWDTAKGTERNTRIDYGRPVDCAAFSPDGARLLIMYHNGAHIWDVATETKLLEFEHARDSAAFCPDGKRVVTACHNGACVWDAATGLSLVFLRHDSPVESVAVSPDGTLVATVSSKMALLWDVMNGKNGRQTASMAHDRGANSICFSPDGRRVVTSSEDLTARIWDAATGIELVRIAHDYPVTSAVYSPDGARIATSSGNAAYVWDSISGSQICGFTHRDRVNTVEFSPDGALVATACKDGVGRIWDVTWAARLTGDRLVRAVARARLVEDGELTANELRTLRPLLGDVNSDVVSLWRQPSQDDAEIEDSLARWHQHRAKAFAIIRGKWTARVAKNKARLQS